jgi:phenylalanyl-tRNA synthetase alpha chain
MLDEIARIAADAAPRIAGAATLDELRALDTDLLGKKGALSGFKAQLGGLDPDQRKQVGAAINDARDALDRAFAARRSELEAVERRATLESERLDLTEVPPSDGTGHLHLVTQAMERLEDVFTGMGFTVAEGPEVETDWHNFGAMNFPPDHPARDMYDTLYVELGEPGSTVLRTHTSPVQVRVMTSQPPPIYSVMPGRVFRQDTPDATHMPVFHQIEGLVIDRGITFADLAGTIDVFTKAFFGGDFGSRLRPSYFPFTEPSAELDITCVLCKGAGCRTCGKTGWLELGGCGMVHPNVLTNVGIDPEEWSGFAFGFGIERMSLMRHGVEDIRELIANDVRFLRQF